MTCQKCGFANPPDLLYCGKCGTQLAFSPDIAASSTKTLERPQESLARGRLLAGRFEILEEIGHGGMGTVFRVLDRKIGEDIAGIRCVDLPASSAWAGSLRVTSCFSCKA